MLKPLLKRRDDKKLENNMSDPPNPLAATAVMPQDNYFVRFLRRKSNCLFLLIMLLISLLSVLQIFMTKLDDKLVTTLTGSLIMLLKETDLLNSTHLFTNDRAIQ